MRRAGVAILALAVIAAVVVYRLRGTGEEESHVLTLASTTSTQNSGLLAYLLPLFKEATGIEVRVVAVGTGQALRLAERGDADVLLVHDPAAEKKFVAAGYGVARREVMYNDFVLLGPAADPAGVRGGKDAIAALKAIAAKGATFLSRGDDSGTHRKELSLWKAAGIDVATAGTWYRAAGAGMGATINVAVGMDGYVLSDRATWLAFKNRGSLEILVEGDPRLFNQYGVIPVDPKRYPHLHAKDAQAFADWLTSAAGQRLIAAYRLEGEQAFFPNAKPGGS